MLEKKGENNYLTILTLESELAIYIALFDFTTYLIIDF